MGLDTDAVSLVVDDRGVATVTLRNEGMRNAITGDVAAGLVEAFDALGPVGDDDIEARCVVLRGEGGFSAGGDVNAMMELQSGGWTLDEAVEHVIEVLGRAVRRVHECPLPTVAAVEGSAVGAGAALAIACDLQVASEEARVGFGFRRVGLAVDSGTSYLLPRLVGDNVAKELVFTGELLDAERAVDLGVLNHAYPADEFETRLDDLVDRIAAGPTVALRASKRLLEQGHDTSLADAIANEAGAQAAVFETEDHAEGVESFFERRDPEFVGQ
ncbi:enoyl-CoA hydratase/isomerase family protein [Halobium salinum]|uniref:Enoyl-CoA hydratase/isomerase family protein n=1 Tax=Halobium salinum TaxID=1364940 RepID=A0ABD5PDH0_9EURY|nr:enoyl-CoA hydratase-related protein [Halobium salinum]